ncbi:hypothetical protein HPP92_016502 [Vanilla planifolia]|uniref:Uncharacterized protein n=1 Tax=Vanilla planifolia TaxID=51239 RepID=A0A835QIZ1_VANPL|nr:hypothetical protein HPP92_016502 [Vanilla planifolia]
MRLKFSSGSFIVFFCKNWATDLLSVSIVNSLWRRYIFRLLMANLIANNSLSYVEYLFWVFVNFPEAYATISWVFVINTPDQKKSEASVCKMILSSSFGK